MRDPPGLVARVVYALPTFEELVRRFTAYVNPSFQEDVSFQRIEACRDIGREPRELLFRELPLGRPTSYEAALAKVKREHGRPALPEELLEYDRRYPSRKGKHPLIALGAFENNLEFPRVACLWHDYHGPELRLVCTNDALDAKLHCLMVVPN